MEIWDLYDRERVKIGEHVRGVELPEEGYHLSVYLWIRNDEGKYLMAQRSEEKSHPLKWECVGGCALKGEDSLTCALREALEETGIRFTKEEGRLLHTKVLEAENGRRYNEFVDVWLFDYNGDVDLRKASAKEIAEAKWMTKEEIDFLAQRGETAPWHGQLRMKDLSWD